jgi:hypothetical protein
MEFGVVVDYTERFGGGVVEKYRHGVSESLYGYVLK